MLSVYLCVYQSEFTGNFGDRYVCMSVCLCIYECAGCFICRISAYVFCIHYSKPFSHIVHSHNPHYFVLIYSHIHALLCYIKYLPLFTYKYTRIHTHTNTHTHTHTYIQSQLWSASLRAHLAMVVGGAADTRGTHSNNTTNNITTTSSSGADTNAAAAANTGGLVKRKNDGLMWMSWHDCLRRFTSLDICAAPR